MTRVRNLLFIALISVTRIPADELVTVGFKSNGLASLRYAGTEFLGNGDFRVNRVQLQSGSQAPVDADLNASIQMDTTRQTLTRLYGWGKVSVIYRAAGNKLTITVSTYNTSQSTIVGVFYEPLGIQFPAAVTEYDGVDPLLADNIGGPTVIPASYGSGVMTIANEDVVRPLMVGLPWAWDKPANSFFPLRINTGRDSMYPDSAQSINRPIAPGASDQYEISIQFGAPGASAVSLGGDILSRFAAAFPQSIHWRDHRPIGALFLATTAAGWVRNPRGWFQDPTVDVTTPAGLTAFHTRVLAYADTSIAYLRSMNAQGMVTWDIEGEQFPAATTYLCDPRQLAALAPEMDGVVDAYFKRFRDAGFRVGICVRPQDLVVAPDLSTASQLASSDPADLLIQKIRYAVNRWNASIFYVDSNGGPNDPMDPAVFRKVSTAFPNVLLMPEHSSPKYYAYTAPGLGLRDGHAETPSTVRAIYPTAFSVIYTADGPIQQQIDELRDGVLHGDILMYRSWFDDEPANSLLKNLFLNIGAPLVLPFR